MIKFNIFKIDKFIKDPTYETILKIKKGDNQLKEKFIKDYTPFILKRVSQTTRKFIEIENSEEFSIGLMAFNEAIDCYDESKNRKFLSFAAQVIERRVINYLRSISKDKNVYPFTYLEFNNNVENLGEYNLDYKAIDAFTRFEIKEEIDAFKLKLDAFGITLYDLVKKSPKHKDALASCIRIARIVAENDEMYKKLNEKKTMPMLELTKIANVSTRTIERNRKFIIAACLIIKSDLDLVKSYLKNAEKGGN